MHIARHSMSRAHELVSNFGGLQLKLSMQNVVWLWIYLFFNQVSISSLLDFACGGVFFMTCTPKSVFSRHAIGGVVDAFEWAESFLFNGVLKSLGTVRKGICLKNKWKVQKRSRKFRKVQTRLENLNYEDLWFELGLYDFIKPDSYNNKIDLIVQKRLGKCRHGWETLS